MRGDEEHMAKCACMMGDEGEVCVQWCPVVSRRVCGVWGMSKPY